jgi:hypothetical protein
MDIVANVSAGVFTRAAARGSATPAGLSADANEYPVNELAPVRRIFMTLSMLVP